MIPETGIVPDVPEDLYHGDTDALSASGAKVLLRNPARFRWEQDNPPPPKDAYDVGTLAHTLILGTGAALAAIPDDLLASNGAVSTKAAKEFVAEARAEGKVPLKSEIVAQVQGMHHAVKAHRLAGAIFSEGEPERSMWWVDEPTGVRLRGRIDWLRTNAIVDLKTTRNGQPDDFERDAGKLGYHISAAHYVEGVERLTGRRLPFVIVAVEKEAPHYVSVHQFDEDYLSIGAAKMRRAIELYAECTAADEWPAYGDDIHTMTPPNWLR